MKVCLRCGEEKPESDFGNFRHSPDGLNNKCRHCCRDLHKVWRDANPEKTKVHEARRKEKHGAQRTISRRAWRKENPLKDKATAKRYRDSNPGQNALCAAQWRKENPVKSREIAFRSRIKREYGITAEEYRERVAEVAGKCGLCKGLLGVPQLDHCHKTGKLRGILCQKCNRGLGHFSDCSVNLREAAAYLDFHSEDPDKLFRENCVA